MIPKNLFRTVPVNTSPQVEKWWEWAVEIHQSWNCKTYRDPLDPDEFPLTSPYWDKCGHGAQLAGLVRLELIHTHGGVYIDSDVAVIRSFTGLLSLPMFAAWEDEYVVPDAVFGAEAGHPALAEMIDLATWLVDRGRDPWDTGPGVFTDVLPNRSDVILLPPAAFYPYHYTKKKTPDARKDYSKHPWTYAVHHWNASWVK